ncbi:MAG TPA: hypothetical protein VMS56_09440, partial [Thermoanaerobaculia bacterium]|nr:hypothetical protein [Thermoanaerobaculia bacterium]
SVESTDLGIEVASSRVLKLSMDFEDTSRFTYVPESLMGGRHQDPALLFDPESGTLFVFWVRHTSPTNGELMVASLRDDVWTAAVPIDAGVFRFQQNLSVAVTRLARAEEAEQPDSELVRAVGVHLVWWEENGYGQIAKYALLQLEQGVLRKVSVGDLLEFAPERNPIPAAIENPAARDLLRHPTVTETPRQSSVEIVFTDWDTNRLQRVDVVPVASNGVLTVPIGVWRGEIPAPEVAFATTGSTGRVSAVLDPTGRNRLVLYERSEGRIEYIQFDGTSWSAVRSIGLERVSEEGAVGALRKLLAAQ